ncbi:MAG TPA: POTRA domain-containing protein, partial [Armatimonadota bacterium]|nr:POTRA domain-containing protein [Armatimonadota bacterium]
MSQRFCPKVLGPLSVFLIIAARQALVPPTAAPAAPAPKAAAPAPKTAAPAPPNAAPPTPAAPAPPVTSPAVPALPETMPAPDNSAFALPANPPALHGTVVAIQFNGLNHLKESAPALFASRLQTRVGAPFSETAIDQDAQMIFNTGYFYNVRPRAEVGPTGITVIFDLVEQPYITSIDITGNKVVSTATLLGLLGTKPDQVLNTLTLQQDLSKIRDYYRSKGYVYGQVLDVPPPTAGVLHIIIGEGIVQKINIEGNKKTKSFVILRAIKTKPGSVFRQQTWQDDLKAIARLNIFSDLHFTVAPGSEPGKIILNLVVTEQRTGTVNFGFGYNTRERGVVFLDLADTNFRGRAESVDANLELGGYRIRGSYKFSFFEPYLGASQYSAGADVFKTQVDRIVPGSSGNGVNGRYFETDTGAGVTLGKRLSETRQLLLDFTNENINSDEIYGNVVSITGGSVNSSSSNVSPFLLQSGLKTTVALRGIINTRDNALNPRSGAFAELMIEPGRGTFSNPGDTQSHPF